jgi:hypothetical protein
MFPCYPLTETEALLPINLYERGLNEIMIFDLIQTEAKPVAGMKTLE